MLWIHIFISQRQVKFLSFLCVAIAGKGGIWFCEFFAWQWMTSCDKLLLLVTSSLSDVKFSCGISLITSNSRFLVLDITCQNVFEHYVNMIWKISLVTSIFVLASICDIACSVMRIILTALPAPRVTPWNATQLCKTCTTIFQSSCKLQIHNGTQENTFVSCDVIWFTKQHVQKSVL